MGIIFYILILGLHIFTLIDALRHIRERNGGLRMILALMPPIIGPIIYYSTKRSNNTKRTFMKGKKRFS